MVREILKTLALAAGLGALGMPAQAQDFPNRPVTIVVGLAPGGITDVTARIYADALSKSIGQRVVVENRQGAGGAVGAAAVQNASPDGYTVLVFSGSQHMAVPAIQSTAPYEPLKGFARRTTVTMTEGGGLLQACRDNP
jgi:tripartite-type tricarboxylate transporter receptor subunit TctC